MGASADHSVEKGDAGEDPDGGTPLLRRVFDHRAQVRAIAHRHGATAIALFGSVGRGEETDSSDLDFLVTMETDRTLFDLARIRFALEDLFCVAVDVVTAGGLDSPAAAELRRQSIPL